MQRDYGSKKFRIPPSVLQYGFVQAGGVLVVVVVVVVVHWSSVQTCELAYCEDALHGR